MTMFSICLMPAAAVVVSEESLCGLEAGDKQGGLMVLILTKEEVVAVWLEGDTGGEGWALLLGGSTLEKADLSAGVRLLLG